MKKLCTFIIALVMLSAWPLDVWAQSDGRKKINMLYLNSYENGYQWSDTILEGIKSVIAESGRYIDLNIEYMDTKIRYDKKVKGHLFDLYAHKYRNVEFDQIIVSDNNGFDFYLQFQGELFPGVPTIFCGVNDFSSQSIQGYNTITGVVESFDIKINLELARKFHPDRKKFVVVGDDGTTGRAIRSQILKAFYKMTDRPPFEFQFLVIGNKANTAKAIRRQILTVFDEATDRPPFEILVAQTLEQLTRNAKAIAEDAFFYFIPFYMDHQHGRYTANEIVQTLWDVTQAPIYTNWKFLVGSGAVGGKVIDGFAHGRAAAQMAMRVLEGEDPTSIPIVKPNDEAYLFDNLVLKKLKISRDDLPQKSQLINHTSYFFEINRQVFWVLIGGVILITVTLVFLTFSISQRKAAESKLKDQLTFVRHLMNTVPIPIYFRNVSGRLTGANLAFEKWFDLEHEKILGYEPHEIASSGLGQLIDSIDNDLLHKTGIRTYEKRIQLNGQDPRDVILHKASYTNTKDKIVGIVGAIHDISKRKLTEKELRESKQMLQLVLDNIPQHVHWKDKDLNYIGANRSFGNFFGLMNLDFVSGKSDLDIIPDRQIAELSIKTDQQVVAQDRAAYHLKWTLHKRNNEKVWLKVNRVPLHDQAGKVMGVLSSAEDITQNVLLENKLVESTKMEAIGTLSGGIAHDFNNILTSIINSTELAIEDIAKDSMAAKDLQRSLKAARRGSRLVKQILTFSRADKEGFKPIQVSDVVREAINLIEASLPRNIQIQTHIATEMALCMADPTQIHQIVLNLCTNAFQSLRDHGGTLSVQLKHAEIGRGLSDILDIDPGSYIKLTISDDGPGIATEIQDKIFNPFFTTKEKGEGTGLGLAVVHGIVKGHNGAIRLSSIPQKCTEFEIYLPMLTTSSLPVLSLDVEAPKGEETILFVEDDVDQLVLIPRVLTQLGYNVMAMQTGREAYERVASEDLPIDLIITDYDMPEMNGLQLAEQVEAHDPHIPVIIVTGRKTPDGMDSAASNIKKLIKKPYNKTTISKAIREVLGFR
jgi:PAS domain S-box-containing protein